MTERGRRRDTGESARRFEPSRWEWAAAAVGAALVLAAVGSMVHEAMTLGPRPIPQIAVRVDTVVAHASGYTVEYRAINDGAVTAARVLIRAELVADTGVVEQSESTIDFVPAHSWRLGGLVFKNDPRRYRIEVHPVGFDRP